MSYKITRTWVLGEIKVVNVCVFYDYWLFKWAVYSLFVLVLYSTLQPHRSRSYGNQLEKEQINSSASEMTQENRPAKTPESTSLRPKSAGSASRPKYLSHRYVFLCHCVNCYVILWCLQFSVFSTFLWNVFVWLVWNVAVLGLIVIYVWK